MTAPIGSLQYVQTLTATLHVYAVVTDGNTPDLNLVTINTSADEGTVIVPGLIGPVGPAGAPQFALQLQTDIFSSPASLPGGLNNTTDVGKYWLVETTDLSDNVVSAIAYVWYGNAYRQLPFGTVGPPGPYPAITPNVVMINPAETSFIETTGSTSNPSWTLNLAVPAGPQGPTGTIANCPDVFNASNATIGQALTFNGQYNQGFPVWQPTSIGDIIPAPYTVPESAFSSFTGVAAHSQTVCTFAVPPNPWAWKPLVWGQIDVHGVQLAVNPLLIGVEVLLGDPDTGTLVARGFGNPLGGVVTLVPQTSSTNSSSSSTNSAMTPSNATALVPANHTGNQGTLYVRLINDGLAAVYDYNSANSQLFVLACPVSTEQPGTALYGSLTPKVTLSAKTITQGS
jgi:hypothetical protein